ncbi:helicase-domain-containing protein [Lactarius quietus]|nr:helicase-domain-containing protein [Lactarius quietus]
MSIGAGSPSVQPSIMEGGQDHYVTVPMYWGDESGLEYHMNLDEDNVAMFDIPEEPLEASEDSGFKNLCQSLRAVNPGGNPYPCYPHFTPTPTCQKPLPLTRRIQFLINNNVKKNHRSFIVLVGDKGRNQVVNLHFLLSKARISTHPSVLWCYKKELGFTRDVKWGIREANDHDPFENFIMVTDICYTYKSKKILRNTFWMLVLQDFEIVEGGRLVVLLLKTMTSLKQLYSLTLDTHACYQMSSHHDVIAHFNKRFILSLGSWDDCLILDNKLNVLPISCGKDITAIEEECGKGKEPSQLKELQESLADTKPICDLIKLTKSVNQAQAILTFVNAIAEKSLSSTMMLTAGRGHGKSTTLELVIAAALPHGYSNILVTSPSPENLKTLFGFIFKGMDALGYEEHLDYNISQSMNPGFNNAIVHINYIQPQDVHGLGQAELVIIDKAVAIPLPLVQNLIGPYLVFLASTINGYKGTRRSLSLKLIQQLHINENTVSSSSMKKAVNAVPPKIWSLHKVKLNTPICYSAGDGIEQWLNKLLCLNATTSLSSVLHGTPHPSKCELFYVSRNMLFSYHPTSDVFLQCMMNQPNNLQLMSNAPAHHLFVLLPLLTDNESHLPKPLVVVQVALEGNISRQVILEGLQCGLHAGEGKFAMMSGAQVMQIATHPDYSNMGYGARALQTLNVYYSGEYFNLDESAKLEVSYPNAAAVDDVSWSLSTTSHRSLFLISLAMPPLLQCLTECKPENLDYLGVSYGLTSQLLQFWKPNPTRKILTSACLCINTASPTLLPDSLNTDERLCQGIISQHLTTKRYYQRFWVLEYIGELLALKMHQSPIQHHALEISDCPIAASLLNRQAEPPFIARADLHGTFIAAHYTENILSQRKFKSTSKKLVHFRLTQMQQDIRVVQLVQVQEVNNVDVAIALWDFTIYFLIILNYNNKYYKSKPGDRRRDAESIEGEGGRTEEREAGERARAREVEGDSERGRERDRESGRGDEREEREGGREGEDERAREGEGGSVGEGEVGRRGREGEVRGWERREREGDVGEGGRGGERERARGREREWREGEREPQERAGETERETERAGDGGTEGWREREGETEREVEAGGKERDGEGETARERERAGESQRRGRERR